jgi:hypothetical protein
MLLSMAERTLTTKAIRHDLEYLVPENEARRIHARVHNWANLQWDVWKKEFAERTAAEAILKMTTPAKTKADKDMVS